MHQFWTLISFTRSRPYQWRSQREFRVLNPHWLKEKEMLHVEKCYF